MGNLWFLMIGSCLVPPLNAEDVACPAQQPSSTRLCGREEAGISFAACDIHRVAIS